ncbi:uncharacterized protein LOC129148352 [Eptesicus fuscus]|uniref:uncharacterized protein LOC129148352 n=1 Tax=Eptesicus fuscus TaxID=29078 RepID=UPI0024041B07|nr:uncharacterized protein LOC129148352 [Eptesicus fuscus]
MQEEFNAQAERHKEKLRQGDLDPLASLKSLTSLSILRNPVTHKKHYRLCVLYKVPQVRVLDFQKVKLRPHHLRRLPHEAPQLPHGRAHVPPELRQLGDHGADHDHHGHQCPEHAARGVLRHRLGVVHGRVLPLRVRRAPRVCRRQPFHQEELGLGWQGQRGPDEAQEAAAPLRREKAVHHLEEEEPLARHPRGAHPDGDEIPAH